MFQSAVFSRAFVLSGILIAYCAMPVMAADAGDDFSKGYDLLESGNPSGAEKYFRTGLKKSDNALAHGLLGDSLFAQQKIAEALTEYEASIKLDSDTPQSKQFITKILSITLSGKQFAIDPDIKTIPAVGMSDCSIQTTNTRRLSILSPNDNGAVLGSWTRTLISEFIGAGCPQIQKTNLVVHSQVTFNTAGVDQVGRFAWTVLSIECSAYLNDVPNGRLRSASCPTLEGAIRKVSTDTNGYWSLNSSGNQLIFDFGTDKTIFTKQ